MMALLRRWLRGSDLVMSSAWLKRQQESYDRSGWEGPRWDWDAWRAREMR